MRRASRCRTWSAVPRRPSARAGARFLASVRRRDGEPAPQAYPWSVPAVRDLRELEFATAVTFFVGENGCGKSTLLEAVAVASRAVALGSRDLDGDDTLAASRALADALIVARRETPRTRAFFRAEDAFGFVLRVASDMRDLGALANALASDATASRSARQRAAGYVSGQRRALARRYGADPHARSHGETFLDVLRERLVPNGLYFLDEPETPFSPTGVLALAHLIADAAEAGSQFIIATHAPLLLALPGATILAFDGGAPRRVAFDDVEHVRLTRAFLRDPARYLERER